MWWMPTGAEVESSVYEKTSQAVNISDWLLAVSYDALSHTDVH